MCPGYLENSRIDREIDSTSPGLHCRENTVRSTINNRNKSFYFSCGNRQEDTLIDIHRRWGRVLIAIDPHDGMSYDSPSGRHEHVAIPLFILYVIHISLVAEKLHGPLIPKKHNCICRSSAQHAWKKSAIKASGPFSHPNIAHYRQRARALCPRRRPIVHHRGWQRYPRFDNINRIHCSPE